MSCTQAEILSELDGKKVSIIGNARSLAQSDYGVTIDRSDLVIRINRAPMPSSRSHGLRTDWLALATTISPDVAVELKPIRIFWMSHKRKRLPFWVASRPGFRLHPLADFEELKADLGAPPTTGLMLINLLAASAAAEINLYGFDFFSSLSLTGSRTAKEVPHDFKAEQKWVARLVDADPRVKLHT